MGKIATPVEQPARGAGTLQDHAALHCIDAVWRGNDALHGVLATTAPWLRGPQGRLDRPQRRNREAGQAGHGWDTGPHLVPHPL